MNKLEQKFPRLAGWLWWSLARVLAWWHVVPRVLLIGTPLDAHQAGCWMTSRTNYGRVLTVYYSRPVGIGTLTIRWRGVYVMLGDYSMLLNILDAPPAQLKGEVNG